MVPQHGIFRFLAKRVGIHNFLCLVACQLHQLSVTGNVCYLQVEGHAALLRAFQVAGATKFQVGLSNKEAVVGVAHDVDALAGFFRKTALAHQDAIRLVGTSPHPAPQLVQLRQSKTFGIENDHDRGIGHIHPHLDNGSGHQNLCFS